MSHERLSHSTEAQNGYIPTRFRPVTGRFQGTIITDCIDSNARQRQVNRYRSLFHEEPVFVPLESADIDLEAGGQLIDALDAAAAPQQLDPQKSIVLVNAAPRGSETRDAGYDNGVPFCYTRYRGNLIFSTYNPRLLSMARITNVDLIDIPTATEAFVADGLLTPDEAEAMNATQFRSLAFLPLAARVVAGGQELPKTPQPIEPDHDIGGRAWFTDSFGNIKTTSLPEDIDYQAGQIIAVRTAHGAYKDAICIPHLADVPTGELAVTMGSSGYGSRRWLEVVVARGNAAEKLGGVAVGDKIFESR